MTLESQSPSAVEPGRIFVVQGDIARLSAHAVACSCSTQGMLGGAGAALWQAFAPRRKWRGFGMGAEVGSCAWVELSSSQGEAKPSGIVVVAVQDDEKSDEPAGHGGDASVHLAALNAARLALGRARNCFPGQRLLIALPLLRTGFAGSSERPLGAARAQLKGMREALDQWASEHPGDAGADAVLVCYTPEHFQTAIEARRKLGLSPRLKPGLAIALGELERAVAGRHCVFFIGSGMSMDSGLPSWSQLIEELARRLQPSEEEEREMDKMKARSDSTDFFLDMAQLYRHRTEGAAASEGAASESTLSRQGELSELERHIRATFTARSSGARPSPAHFWLASLRPRHIVTTNYDDLLEEALEALHLYATIVRREEDVALAGGPGTHVVKMHGDARDPRATIVLGRDDYDAFFDRRPALAALLQGLMLNQTFVFLGYSLRDPNFRQIYHRIGAMLPRSQRTAYAATVGEPSPLQAELWQHKKIEPLNFQDERELWVFLDALCERASGSERLFLSPEMRSPESQPGSAFEQACKYLGLAGQAIVEAAESSSTLDAQQAAQLARALEFLSACGWRPPASWGSGFDQRSQTLQSLAARLEDREAQRALLISALSEARSAHQAEELRAEIERLQSNEPPRPTRPGRRRRA